MPRELFGDVTGPSITLGTRKWYSVPLSFAAHTLALGALVVAPLVATGALPLPDNGPLIINLEPPPLPQPPPVPRRSPAPPQTTSDAAPTVAPDRIAPEPMLEPFEPDAPEVGISDVFGIEGGITAVAPPPAVAIPAAPATPIPVGGNIKAPQRIGYIAPAYPAVALAARIRGLVIIQAVIDTTGRVRDARILRSDSALLNDAALAAVRQWTYTPTLLNGVPVSVVMTVTVNFQLQGGGQ